MTPTTREIPLTRGKVALIDEKDYELVKSRKWRALPTKSGVRAATTGRDGEPQTVMMHRLILNAPAGQWVDHRNGNPLDNRRRNLRFATTFQNAQNKRSRSKHGFKGVAFNDTKFLRTPYFARITDKGKTLHLGYFTTAEEAARAYDTKAAELFGEFAALNFKPATTV